MSDNADKLKLCQSACEVCRACALGETKTNTVFGTGSPNAALMFVGEAPGEREDATGIPFVGAAGQLLDRYLFEVGIPRSDVYIANILKCRPPRNRDPLPEEQDACIEHLRTQVRIIRPRIIVYLTHQARLPHHARARCLVFTRHVRNVRRIPPLGAPARSLQARGYAGGYVCRCRKVPRADSLRLISPI